MPRPHVAQLSVRDIANEVQYVYIQSPPRFGAIAEGAESVAAEMAPVFALYREHQNAPSAYYRVPCLYKIMEGLLGPLRASVQSRARERQFDLKTPKACVPDHPDIAIYLRDQIGRPMRDFFDNFLTKQYRDAVAHFELTGQSALNLSSPLDAERFWAVAFLAELCVRRLIERHEASLRELQ